MLTADFEGHIYNKFSRAVAEAAAKTVVEAAVAESEYRFAGAAIHFRTRDTVSF